MKIFTRKIFFCFLIFSGRHFSQTLTVSAGASSICMSNNSASVTAQINSTVVGANQYTWAAVSGSNNGIVSVTNGTIVQITFTTCGLYNIYCTASFTSSTTSPSLITAGFTTVNVICAPIVSIIGNSSVCGTNSVALGALGAVSYTWLPIASNASTISVQPLIATCYTVMGTSSLGCVGTAVKCVSISPQPTVNITGGGTVCAGTPVSFSATGASTYQWFIGATTYTGTSVVFTPSASTCFSVKGIVANTGCFTYTGACVTVQGNTLSITGSSYVCAGASSTLTASGATSFTWFPNNSTSASIVVTPSANTCYTVVGNSGGACNSYGSYCVNLAPNPSISVSGGSFCPGQPRTLSATGASSFIWSPFNLTGSVVVVSPTANVCYTVTGITSIGCMGTATNCLVQTTPPNVTVSTQATVCANSTINITASGASSYTWYPQNTTGSSAAISPTANTCYTVVGAANGCTNSAVHCMTVLPVPSISVVSSGSACAGAAAGFTASGGTSYIWFIGTQTVSGAVYNFSPTSTSCFTVRATGANNCPVYTGSCITVPSGSLSIAGPSTTCAGVPVSFTASGALSYTWFPGGIVGATVTFTPTGNSCYTVIASDGSGCNVSLTKCITVSAGLNLAAGGNTICAGQTKTLSVSGASSYTWLPFNTNGATAVITPTANVCYTVIGTNSLGCVGSAANCLTVVALPNLSITAPATTCANSSFSLSASGAVTYTWLPGNSNASVITSSASANSCYTLVGRSNGCNNSAVHCLSISPSPTLSIAGNNTLCASQTTTLSASGAISYTWNTGSNSSTILAQGYSACYTVYGKNNLGCIGYASKCVTLQPITLQITPPTATVCKGSSVTFSVSGANSYTWNTNATTSTLNLLPVTSSTYAVFGINSVGCSTYTFCTVYVDTTCSNVWPGDANNDGLVSLSDVFELGLAYNTSGTSRSPGGNNYISQFANNWAGTVSTGKNKCHADCNGNGTINLADTLAIWQNFGLTHTFKPLPASTQANVLLSPSTGNFVAAAWNKVDVIVDPSTGNHFGLGFVLNYEPQYIEPDSVYLVYTASYINANATNVEFRKYDFANTTLYAASTRTDVLDVAQGGKIAELHFKVKSTVPDLALINLNVSEAIAMNSNLQLNILSGAGSQLQLSQSSTGISKTAAETLQISVTPQPAANEIQLAIRNCNQNRIHVRITDAIGRQVFSNTFTASQSTFETTLSTSALSNGVYFIEICSEGKVQHKKIIISR